MKLLFQATKSGKGNQSCEDAVKVSDDTLYLAIADGTSSSPVYSGYLATFIVEQFVKSARLGPSETCLSSPEAFSAWINRLPTDWLRFLSKHLKVDAPAVLRHNWQTREKDSSCTFAGVCIYETADDRTRLTLGVLGDCSVFHIASDFTHYSEYTQPKTSERSHATFALTFTSESDRMPVDASAIILRSVDVDPGDYVLLATDHLARWIRQALAKKIPSEVLAKLFSVRGEIEFQDWLNDIKLMEMSGPSWHLFSATGDLADDLGVIIVQVTAPLAPGVAAPVERQRALPEVSPNPPPESHSVGGSVRVANPHIEPRQSDIETPSGRAKIKLVRPVIAIAAGFLFCITLPIALVLAQSRRQVTNLGAELGRFRSSQAELENELTSNRAALLIAEGKNEDLLSNLDVERRLRSGAANDVNQASNYMQELQLKLKDANITRQIEQTEAAKVRVALEAQKDQLSAGLNLRQKQVSNLQASLDDTSESLRKVRRQLEEKDELYGRSTNALYNEVRSLRLELRAAKNDADKWKSMYDTESAKSERSRTESTNLSTTHSGTLVFEPGKDMSSESSGNDSGVQEVSKTFNEFTINHTKWFSCRIVLQPDNASGVSTDVRRFIDAFEVARRAGKLGSPIYEITVFGERGDVRQVKAAITDDPRIDKKMLRVHQDFNKSTLPKNTVEVDVVVQKDQK